MRAAGPRPGAAPGYRGRRWWSGSPRSGSRPGRSSASRATGTPAASTPAWPGGIRRHRRSARPRGPRPRGPGGCAGAAAPDAGPPSRACARASPPRPDPGTGPGAPRCGRIPPPAGATLGAVAAGVRCALRRAASRGGSAPRWSGTPDAGGRRPASDVWSRTERSGTRNPPGDTRSVFPVHWRGFPRSWGSSWGSLRVARYAVPQRRRPAPGARGRSPARCGDAARRRGRSRWGEAACSASASAGQDAGGDHA